MSCTESPIIILKAHNSAYFEKETNYNLCIVQLPCYLCPEVGIFQVSLRSFFFLLNHSNRSNWMKINFCSIIQNARGCCSFVYLVQTAWRQYNSWKLVLRLRWNLSSSVFTTWKNIKLILSYSLFKIPFHFQPISAVVVLSYIFVFSHTCNGDDLARKKKFNFYQVCESATFFSQGNFFV